MPFFSRLTDIVTCNLTEMIARGEDPAQTLTTIIREMEDGLAGAQRSARTAQANAEKMEGEILECRRNISYWTGQAKDSLKQKNEEQARFDLLRKKENEDLLAALSNQQSAALSTREQLLTTMRALEVRLGEARRKLAELQSTKVALDETSQLSGDTKVAHSATPEWGSSINETRAQEVEAELEALRKELLSE